MMEIFYQSCQRPKKLLTTKSSVVDVWQGSKCTSGPKSCQRFLEFTGQQILWKRINFRKFSAIHCSAQKMKFFIKDLATFIEEILNGKLYFLRSARKLQGISSKILKTKWMFIFTFTFIYPHTLKEDLGLLQHSRWSAGSR